VSRKLPPAQTGAALVVGLVLLLVLTLLAVSTMRTAALELLMAGNTQYRENAFRLAEAGLADAEGQAPGLVIPATGWTTDLGAVRIDDLDGEYQATITFLDEGEVYSGYSSSEFQFFHYQIDATGRADQRGARSTQSQGLVQVNLRSPE